MPGGKKPAGTILAALLGVQAAAAFGQDEWLEEPPAETAPALEPAPSAEALQAAIHKVNQAIEEGDALYGEYSRLLQRGGVLGEEHQGRITERLKAVDKVKPLAEKSAVKANYTVYVPDPATGERKPEKADKYISKLETKLHTLESAHYNQQGRPKEAVEAALKGAAKDPANPMSYQEGSRALYALGDFVGAAALAERALAISPGLSDSNGLLTAARAGAGDLDGAIEAGRTALARNPGNKLAQVNMKWAQDMKAGRTGPRPSPALAQLGSG